MTHLTKAVWGPACWTMIHAAAASCEPEEARAFSAFLYSLTHVLPCPECRMHLRSYLSTHPPESTILNAETASRFCFDLHNYVNHETGKPSQSPTTMWRLYDVKLESLKVGSGDGSRSRRRMPRSSALLSHPMMASTRIAASPRSAEMALSTHCSAGNCPKDSTPTLTRGPSVIGSSGRSSRSASMRHGLPSSRVKTSSSLNW